MVQQMIAVLRTFTGLQRGWSPPTRAGGQFGFATLARCHALETLSGIALVVGIVAGVVTLWLIPIAVSLVLAIPLSALSGMSIRGVLRNSEDYAAPQITRAARHYRKELKALSDDFADQVSPAE